MKMRKKFWKNIPHQRRGKAIPYLNILQVFYIFRKQEFIKNVKRDLANRVATIVVSHPFHVITIRMMAQFIGRETKYP